MLSDSDMPLQSFQGKVLWTALLLFIPIGFPAWLGGWERARERDLRDNSNCVSQTTVSAMYNIDEDFAEIMLGK